MRFAASLVFALILPLGAFAYTIVMRGGHHVEIPARFIVTRSTLTYEVGTGISITLQMSSIDIAATERANNEPPGSLLARVFEPESQTSLGSASPAPRRAQRTITNRDLETSRRARQASEVAYERRRLELGLPSPEESRRRVEAEAERARAELSRSASDEAEAEAYWRSQASGLRAQLAALNAQIDYVRELLAQYPARPAVGSYTIVTGVAPLFPRHGVAGFPTVGRGRSVFTGQPGININPAFGGHAPLAGNSGVFVAPNIGPQLTVRAGIGGGAVRGQVFLNTRGARGGFGHPFGFPPGVFAQPLTVIGSPYPGYSFADDDRSELLARLRELELERAGLQARWRVLEDEARRAGALPGWLRP